MKEPAFQSQPAGRTAHLTTMKLNEACVQNIRRAWKECGVDILVESSIHPDGLGHIIQSNLINGLPHDVWLKRHLAQLRRDRSKAAA